MSNWIIEENIDIHNYLLREEIKIGDTIELITNNQLGYKKYEVIQDNNRKKSLKLLIDWSEDFE